MNRKSPCGDTGRENYWQTVRRWFLHHRPAYTSLVVLAIICTAVILAPVIAPYDPDAIAGPFGAPPGLGSLLGTDQIGRDMLPRLLYATHIFLPVDVLATVIPTAIGVSLGLLGGYFGGWLDIATMHFTDMAVSSPYILLVLMAAAVSESGLWSIMPALGFVDWSGITWLARGNVLSLRETSFVKNSIVVGMPARHILLSEIFLNTIASILAYATSVMALSILDEASLSSLGMGVQPPTASLGNMLNSAQSLTVLTKQPWLWIPPGLLIVVLVVAINFVGDALGDALNPSAVPNLGGVKQDTPEQDAAKQDMPDGLQQYWNAHKRSISMTIHQIECFPEAARVLNFTEAANHLYISQQGLSRQIASLEKELELRLFDRTARDVKLTRSGELLLWCWKDTPKETYGSVGMAREERERAKRRINLSVMDMSGIIEMVGNILTDYMVFDPEMESEINEFTNIRDIINGNPDLMMTVSFTLSYEQLKEKCGLMVIKKLPLYYVMSKKNPLAQKENVVMEDFKGETMLCLFKNFFAGAKLWLFELIVKQEHALQKARYYENINSLELAVIANEGIHIGFREFYHNYGGRLVMHPMPNSRNQAYTSVTIVWRKENEKRLESFIKFSKNNYNQQQCVVNYPHSGIRQKGGQLSRIQDDW